MALCAITVEQCEAALVGSLERADWAAVQGWACDDSLPASKQVQVYFFTYINGFWTQIGNSTADRYRADVGRSGTCGGGAYHGFVFANLPQALLDDETHDVYAYASAAGTGMKLLDHAPQAVETGPVGLWDPGLKHGSWRTDYPSPRLGTADAPLSMDKDESGKCFLWTSPDYLMAGASIDAYLGPAHECLATPDTYIQSNAASSEPTHVSDNFWVVTANVEKAFETNSACNSGPPNQSVPISAPGTGLASLVTLPAFDLGSPGRKRAHLILNTSHDNCEKIPFLSYGVQSGFGNGGNAPVTVLRQPGAPVELSFGATLYELAPDRSLQNAAYLFVEAVWSGRKRWAYIYLLGRNVGSNLDRQHFNWNIRESVWFPGADIVYRDLARLNTECADTPGWTPLTALAQGNSVPELGVRRSYVVNLESLFVCLGGSRFSEPMPVSGPIPITGIHFAIEQGPARNNWTHLAIDGVDLTALSIGPGSK